MTRISSRLTWWQKVGLPVFMFGLLAVGGLTDGFEATSSTPVEFWWAFFLVILFQGLVIYPWLCLPLKHVWMGSSSFRVEGLRERIEVPFSAIESVERSYWANPEAITLVLKAPSAFGTRIKFLPSLRFVPFGAHPTFRMLAEKFGSGARASNVSCEGRS